ncbi:hypothetical protein RSAG8_06369, partial [Rhizoctonia solani AG-8 WAC10335]
MNIEARSPYNCKESSLAWIKRRTGPKHVTNWRAWASRMHTGTWRHRRRSNCYLQQIKVMSLMSLRESVARSKDKWKKRLHLGSKIGSPTPLGANNTPAASSSEAENQPAKSGMAWSGVKALNKVLESSSDVFGPLKSAIGGLNKCIDIYEVCVSFDLRLAHLISKQRASKGRKDYDELREKLDGLLSDLAGHMAQPMDPMMTDGVKLLCRGIEAEVRKVEGKQVHNMGQRLLDAMDTSEDILECYRRINGHVERLMLNANMSILKTINELTTVRMIPIPRLSADGKERRHG